MLSKPNSAQALAVIPALMMVGTFSACDVDVHDPQETLESTSQALTANGFGFAWSDQLTGTFTPNSNYAVNTSGGAITIQNTSAGRYVVTFAGLGGSGGNAHVVAYGTDSTRCKVESWSQSGVDEKLDVRCHTPTGSLVNSRFIVRYRRGASSDERLGAYLLADQQSTAWYSPTTTYNSTGLTNTVTRLTTGRYLVYLPGLGGADGNILVTAYGTTSAHCNVVDWDPDLGDQRIDVHCWSTAGVLADSRFSLAFDGAQTTGLWNVGGHVWANDSTSASYTPGVSYYSPDFFCNGSGGTLAGRLGTGRYFIRRWFELGGYNSTVHVTARNFPGAPDYCKIESSTPIGNGNVEVKTRCFSSSGSPKNSQYFESYYTSRFQGPC